MAAKGRTKLTLNIKGSWRNVFAPIILWVKARKLKLKLHKVKNISGGHLEIIVFGDKNNLWEIINWTKGQTSVFFFLNEVNFEFSESVE